jgi:PKD repeat protein
MSYRGLGFVLVGLTVLFVASCGITTQPTLPTIDSVALSPSHPVVGEAVKFTPHFHALGTTTFGWNVGGGSGGTPQVSSVQQPSFTFASAGNYTATLTISDGRGQTATYTVDFVVLASQP